MRQARLARVASRLEEAQNKAHERSVALTEDVNRKTDRSIERSLQANREMEKAVALENSVLGRQGKSLPEQSITRTAQAPAKSPAAPRDKESLEVNRSMVSKRRAQVDPTANGEDSIPPNLRKALNQGIKNVNDPQPQLRVQNQRVVARSAQSKLVSQGVSTNIAEEARRRKRLEAHIHQLANQQ